MSDKKEPETESLEKVKQERDEWKNEALTSRLVITNLAQRNANATAEAAHWQTQYNILASKKE